MITEEIHMKKLLLLAFAFFGIGGSSVASANTVIVDEPTPYEEQLRIGAQLSHRHHHGYHHRHHRYRGYYDGYYYYYPRHRYRDYYYYY